MLKKGEKVLLGAAIVVGAVDLFLANSTYLKKKGVVLRDMVLTALDPKARTDNEEGSPAEEIPIE